MKKWIFGGLFIVMGNLLIPDGLWWRELGASLCLVWGTCLLFLPDEPAAEPSVPTASPEEP
jgi:hypothetical protein